jgi:hypothetical protein
MVKVLNRDVDNQVFYRQLCEECRAELEYAFDDTHEGALGLRYLTCPACGKEIASKLDGIKLTPNNIEFPKHFMAMSENAVDIDNEEIQKWVRKCLKIAEESNEPYGYFVSSGTGNSRVILMAYEDEYDIVVAKNYYETNVHKY